MKPEAENELRLKIKKLLDKPMTYSQIHKAIGKTEAYGLAICLTRMTIDKEIFYGEPKAYSSEAPVYSSKPIPKKFEYPKRDKKLSEVKDDELPDR